MNVKPWKHHQIIRIVCISMHGNTNKFEIIFLLGHSNHYLNYLSWFWQLISLLLVRMIKWIYVEKIKVIIRAYDHASNEQVNDNMGPCIIMTMHTLSLCQKLDLAIQDRLKICFKEQVISNKTYWMYYRTLQQVVIFNNLRWCFIVVLAFSFVWLCRCFTSLISLVCNV